MHHRIHLKSYCLFLLSLLIFTFAFITLITDAKDEKKSSKQRMHTGYALPIVNGNPTFTIWCSLNIFYCSCLQSVHYCPRWRSIYNYTMVFQFRQKFLFQTHQHTAYFVALTIARSLRYRHPRKRSGLMAISGSKRGSNFRFVAKWLSFKTLVTSPGGKLGTYYF